MKRSKNISRARSSQAEYLGTVKGMAVDCIPKPKFRHKQTISSVETQDVLGRFHALCLTDTCDNSSPGFRTKETDWSINHRCSCGDVQDVLNVSSMSGSSSDSEAEEEEESMLAVQQILKALIAAEVKGQTDHRQIDMLMKVVEGCKTGEAVSDVYLQQFLKLLTSHQDPIVMVSLAVLQFMTSNKQNCLRILSMNALQNIIQLMEVSQSEDVIKGAASLFHEVIKHPEGKDVWLEYMIIQGLPTLMKYTAEIVLSETSASSSLLSAICGLLSEASKYQDLAILMLDQFMPHFLSLLDSTQTMKVHGALLALLCNISSHNDYTASVILSNKTLLQRTDSILRSGPCSVQEKVIVLYNKLIMTERGLEVFLFDRAHLKPVFSVMEVAHCRNVRQVGFTLLLNLLCDIDTLRWMKVLTLVKEACPNSGKSRGTIKPNTRKKKENLKDDASMHGLGELCSLLMQAVYSEGKIGVDNSEVKVVRFRPGVDSCKTLHLIVLCFLKVIYHVTSMTNTSKYFHNQLPTLSRGSILLKLVQSDLLHVICLLNRFAIFQGSHLSNLSQVILQRNIESLYLQASLKVWQSKSDSNDRMSRLIISNEESGFIRDILDLCLKLARFSCTMWTKDLTDTADFMGERQETSICRDETSFVKSDHIYVENIAQVFQSGGCHDNNLQEPSFEMEGKGHRIKGSTKLAWGSDSVGREKSKARKNVKSKEGSECDPEFGVTVCLKELVGECPNERIYENDGMTSPARIILQRKGKKKEPEVVIDGTGDCSSRDEKYQLDVRKRLVNCGLIESVCSWISVQDHRIQHTAVLILRCLIQPWYPEEVKNHFHLAGSKRDVLQTQRVRIREMADSLAERDKLLTEILRQVSADTGSIITDALGGQQPSSELKKHSERKLQQKEANNNHVWGTNLPINREEPLCYQISLQCLALLGPRLSAFIQQGSGDILLEGLHLIYDFAIFGDITIHLKLASIGVLSALIEVATNGESKANMLALKTLFVLVEDLRMKQLFLSDGGHIFLEQMKTSTTNKPILEEINRLLAVVSHEPGSLLY